MRDYDSLDRRTFLKGVASVGAELTARHLGAQGPEQPGPLSVEGEVLRVEFRAESGVPVRYLLVGAKAELGGGEAAPEALVCEKAPWRTVRCRAEVTAHRAAKSSMEFDLRASVDGHEAATWTVRYVIDGSRLTVSQINVRERDGYDLLHVRLSGLVVLRGSQANAWMAHGDTGGSLIELASARPGELVKNQFWGDILSTLPVLMAGDGQIFCVLQNQGFMDGGVMSISRERTGAMGTVQRHRVDGSECADLNLGKGQPLNCGDAGTPNLLVGQEPVCQLDFFAVEGPWRQAWLRGARHVRKRLPAKRTEMYDGVYTYGIRVDEPSWPEPATTFAQCEDIIRSVAALTGNSPQIVHLWGWQFRGKDTGYPAVNVVDERVGGREGLLRLMEAAKKYNARVTLSDNYDDGYRSSPGWDERIVARRPDGQLYNSRSWTGEISYILGLAKYVKHGALERVGYTCDEYKLPGTIHVDVLTYYAVRNDWDRAHPASGYRNLVDGKFRVLDAFHAKGVDVSSEAPRFPFMGKVSFYWQGCGIHACPMGGSAIPLFAAVYRQAAVWGDGMRRGDTHPGAQQVFYGGGPRFMTRNSEDRSLLAETFYLQAVPWMLLHRRNIISFEQDGNLSRIGIEGGEVRVSLESGEYSVSVGETQVAAQDWVACPIGADRIAFYSMTGRTLTHPLPAGWDPAVMRSAALGLDGHRDAAFAVDGGMLKVVVAARVPVLVGRSAGALSPA